MIVSIANIALYFKKCIFVHLIVTDSMLYPLKFIPLYKERIWGGHKIKTLRGEASEADARIGESWDLSAVQGNLSVAANGILAGNNIEELTEVYMGDLVGDKVFRKYGIEFPVLIKLIDASDALSVQVHPGDELARERHNAYGKSEMWYVLDAAGDAAVYLGFKEGVDRSAYLGHLKAGTLSEILNRFDVTPGMAFFIPPGTIHAIGKGVVVAEIQQTSDITYRVFDWNRVDKKGRKRALHLGLALDALAFRQPKEDFIIDLKPLKNRSVRIKETPWFTVNMLWVEGEMERDYFEIDSFVAYVCVEGGFEVEYGGGKKTMTRGETLLIPASLDYIMLKGSGKILEVFVP